jgi:hypothetical protein
MRARVSQAISVGWPTTQEASFELSLHRSLAQRPPAPPPETIPIGDNVSIHRTRLLGGLINEYRNAA